MVAPLLPEEAIKRARASEPPAVPLVFRGLATCWASEELRDLAAYEASEVLRDHTAHEASSRGTAGFQLGGVTENRRYDPIHYTLEYNTFVYNNVEAIMG